MYLVQNIFIVSLNKRIQIVAQLFQILISLQTSYKIPKTQARQKSQQILDLHSVQITSRTLFTSHFTLLFNSKWTLFKQFSSLNNKCWEFMKQYVEFKISRMMSHLAAVVYFSTLHKHELQTWNKTPGDYHHASNKLAATPLH